MNKDLVRAALICKHLEIVIIREDENDNSIIIKDFLDECGTDNYNISSVNDAPQKETTAYLIYECCPKADVIFGEKDAIFDLMLSKHNFIAWDDPSMAEVNKKTDDILSESSSKSTN